MGTKQETKKTQTKRAGGGKNDQELAKKLDVPEIEDDIERAEEALEEIEEEPVRRGCGCGW